MRPYRGLTKDGKWVKGWHCQIGNRHFIATEPYDIGWSGGEVLKWHIAGFIEVIPETVGQQIGLPDKNGVEIYEGSLVNYWSSDKTSVETFVVAWDDCKMGYILTQEGLKIDNGLWNRDWGASVRAEVIGNIHQEVKI